MFVTLESLRRHLNGCGCFEERVLRPTGDDIVFIEFKCAKKGGKVCRAVLTARVKAPPIPRRMLERIGKQLAPCLERGWHARIPPENPFA
jgi:hypothetical protein